MNPHSEAIRAVSQQQIKIKTHARTTLEGHLGALEVRDTSTGPVGHRGASTTTSTATAASTSTTATTATTTATASTAASAGSTEVETHGAALQVSTVQLVVGFAGLVNGRELHVAEALGAAAFRVGGKTDAHDAATGSKQLAHGVLVGTERNVANEQGVTLRAGLVTEGASTSLHTLLAASLVVGRTASCIVEVDGTAINVSALLSFESLGRVDRIGELNVAESNTDQSVYPAMA